eukprot:6002113-Alexandrium_andersonii.AAC.1
MPTRMTISSLSTGSCAGGGGCSRCSSASGSAVAAAVSLPAGASAAAAVLPLSGAAGVSPGVSGGSRRASGPAEA